MIISKRRFINLVVPEEGMDKEFVGLVELLADLGYTVQLVTRPAKPKECMAV